MLVTYMPREGDLAHTKLKGGIVLRAGEPREIHDPELCAILPKNPWFKCEGKGVDDGEQTKKLAARAETGGWDKRRKPKTAEDYRAYAISWINESMPDESDDDGERAAANCKAAMRKRWDDEAQMRVACGVGEDDLDQINGIYGPKLAQLGG